MNGDDAIDMVAANADSDDVSVFLNQGAGVFADEIRHAVGRDPSAIALGDFNGDGVPDMVVANRSSADVSVLVSDCPVPCDALADCNANGVSDCDEIVLDPTLDDDLNGVLDAQVFYSAGVTNRIRIEADIAASTYSVWVTPDGGVETQIASNYAFRTSQQGITEIDTLGVWSVDPDAFTVCDVEYGPTGALGSCPCLPDLDGNGSVGFADLTMLIAQWGACL